MDPVQMAYDMLDSLLKDEVGFTKLVDALFEGADKNKDKTLSLDEMEDTIKSACVGVLKVTPTKEVVKEIFEKLDLDKSKTIDKKEYANFWRHAFEKQKDELAEKLKK
eukprot:TRINITY_DN8723_c0_g2_i3.p3 TRINITY_DN8723_c0_g2~~TRINITY_DN8723_c0_g2_i3.p3  ORF type:complete len:108 (-),score=46.49 TRINITY_DN8723_c0_g2_i3:73-396(-)